MKNRFSPRNSAVVPTVLAALAGAALDEASRAAAQGWAWLRGQCATCVFIPLGSSLYTWTRDWLAAHPSAGRASRFEAYVNLDWSKCLAGVVYDGAPPDAPLPEIVTEYEVVEAQGVDFDRSDFDPSRLLLRPAMPVRHFRHNGMWITVREVAPREKEGGGAGRAAPLAAASRFGQVPPPPHSDDCGGGGLPGLELYVFGRDREAPRRLLAEVMSYHLDRVRRERKCSVYLSRQHSGWVHLFTRPMRPLESVVLPESTAITGIVREATRFLASREWYQQMGIPHRLGFCLEGPPGTGKSSAIQAICGELGLDLFIVNLGADWMDDDTLQTLMNNLPDGCALCIEDVDAAWGRHVEEGESDSRRRRGNMERHGYGGQGGTSDSRYSGSSLTFSGLLNCLDGPTATEGRILFLTTNHPERLDPALMRRGRVDFRIRFDHATERQVAGLYERFFPTAPKGHADDVAAAIAPHAVTMSDVQFYLLVHRDDENEAWQRRGEFAQILWPNGRPQQGGAGEPAKESVTA